MRTIQPVHTWKYICTHTCTRTHTGACMRRSYWQQSNKSVVQTQIHTVFTSYKLTLCKIIIHNVVKLSRRPQNVLTTQRTIYVPFLKRNVFSRRSTSCFVFPRQHWQGFVSDEYLSETLIGEAAFCSTFRWQGFVLGPCRQEKGRVLNTESGEWHCLSLHKKK